MAPRLAHCLALLAVFVAVAAASCVVSPQPSPPDVILDDDRIGLTPGVEGFASVIGFEAAPGTVKPAQGVVVITNLDADDAPSFAKVEPDGSFAVAVPGQSGQTFRFQAKNGAARSEPVDVAVNTSGTAIDTATAVAPSCLVLDPSGWLALDGAADARSLVIRNDCGVSATIAAPRLRRGLGAFSFSPTTPITVPAGGVATLTVHAGSGAETEDVLILDVKTPAPGRRSITLTVPDR